MSLVVNLTEARRVFEAALTLARSESALPEKWLEHARAVSRTSYAAFTPMLGTALLAKATNKQVDALSLKRRSSFKGYSARSVVERVLMPRCVEEGIDLRSLSPNPLNTSTFLRPDAVSRDLAVRSQRDRDDVNVLCDALEDADFLDARDEGIRALAAFLRVRIEETEEPQAVDLGENTLPLAELALSVEQFINKDTEGGRRGQAMVAACLELVFPSVIGAGVNDPDRRAPGDVGAMGSNNDLILAAEAKQKQVDASMVLIFSRRLAEAGVGKGIYAALAPNQDPDELGTVSQTAAERHSVTLHVFTSVQSLLTAAFLWSPESLEDCLQSWPSLFQGRLIAIGVRQQAVDQWAERFRNFKQA